MRATHFFGSKKMKAFIILCVLGLACAIPQYEWQMFKSVHKKTYKNIQEERFRMNVFFDNKKKIDEHNLKFENGQTTYTLKMNHFGDLMPHEIKAIMNGLKHTTTKREYPIFNKSHVPVPDSIDWRQKGAVTPVKDQGKCGSCWAFSSTGALEGQLFLKTGRLVSLSEQNLVDCSFSYGNGGCDGGLMDQAFTYIQDNHGVDTEESYPYEAVNGQCRFNAANVGGTDIGYVDVPNGDEEALKQAIGTVGPVSVAIDASQSSFHFYSSGVYVESSCNSQELDHGVLAVGYGTEKGQDYWLVKNSWNSGWGEGGYIKMARNRNNHCGIATSASYPVV